MAESLRTAGCTFHSVDILRDEPLRAQLKVMSDWPTYPQLYVAGELLGGCDIVAEMQVGGWATGEAN